MFLINNSLAISNNPIIMFEQDDLTAGLAYYQKHEYLPALKHFSKGAAHQKSQISQMILQSLQGMTNMQLCNYTRAAEQFNTLKTRLDSWQTDPSEPGRRSEVELLRIKVLANLMIIHLVNCNEQVQETLNELLFYVKERYNENKTAGVGLFRALLRALFGFESFSDFQEQVDSMLQKVDSTPKGRNSKEGFVVSSPLFLSSMAIYSHLTGNIQDAIRLEKYAYDMTRYENPTAAVISLRHLQQLQKQSGNERQRKSYHQELKVLMSNQELEGIAEQTLFRNYSLKISYATQIISKLSETQRQMMVERDQFSDVARRAVLVKLKTMRNQSNMGRVDAVIEILKKDGAVLDIMSDAEFVEDALRDYDDSIARLQNVLQQIYSDRERELMKYAIRQIQAYKGNQREQKYASFRDGKLPNKSHQNQRREQSQIQQYKPNIQIIPPKPKKNIEIDIPQKTISSFRAQRENPYRSSPSPMNSSRVDTKPVTGTKMMDRKHVYLNEAQKPKYKIGKDEPKKGNKQQKGRQTREKTNQDPSERDVDVSDRNPIDQFMRQVVPAREKTYQPPMRLPVKQKQKQRQKERKEILEQLEQSEASKIPITNKNTNAPPKSAISPIIPKSSVQIKKTASVIKSEKSFVDKSILKQYYMQYPQRLQAKLRKYITLCMRGQYIEKRHFSSDGGAQRFLMLGKHKDMIYWGQDEDRPDQSSYSIQDIKGIVFGKVTETLLKQANRKLEPWKCFSLIMKKRTFDVYCPQEVDLKFWISGLSIFLKELKYDSSKYAAGKSKTTSRKKENVSHRVAVLGQNVLTRYYSTGRLLWKRFLLRMQWQHLTTKKKEKRNLYCNANAYAIVVAAVKVMNYVPEKLKLRMP